MEGVLVKYGLRVGELDGCWLGIRRQLRLFVSRGGGRRIIFLHFMLHNTMSMTMAS